MSATWDALTSALFSHVLLAVPLVIVLGVAVWRHRAKSALWSWRPVLIGLGTGVALVIFVVASLVGLQMVDFRALPGFVETLALVFVIAGILGLCFSAGWLTGPSPRTWSSAAAAAGGHDLRFRLAVAAVLRLRSVPEPR